LIAAFLSTALLVPAEALDAGAASAASIVDHQGLLGGVIPAPWWPPKPFPTGSARLGGVP
jgi:hypothetical protein